MFAHWLAKPDSLAAGEKYFMEFGGPSAAFRSSITFFSDRCGTPRTLQSILEVNFVVTYTAFANAGGKLKFQWKRVGMTVNIFLIDDEVVNISVKDVADTVQSNNGILFARNTLQAISHYAVTTRGLQRSRLRFLHGCHRQRE